MLENIIKRLISLYFDRIGWLYQRYYFLTKFPLFHIHFISNFDDLGQTSLRVIRHSTFIEEKEAYFNKLRLKLSPEALIQKVFESRNEFRFVILVPSIQNRFIQFWFEKENILFDFPIVEQNDNDQFKDDIVSLLKKMRFMQIEDKLNPLCFQILPDTIRADFGDNTSLAVRFTARVFDKIFKHPLANVRLELG